MSAFRSAARVARYELGSLDWLAGDIFINQAKVGALRCPVLLIHGRYDDIVPAEHGQDLAARCRPPAPLVLLECGHNDVLARYADVFLAEVAQLLDRITTAPSPSPTPATQS
jgi:pimeloyl-ACP methyl ester carboxylesterase